MDKQQYRLFVNRTRDMYFNHKKRAEAYHKALNFKLDDLRSVIQQELENPCIYCTKTIDIKNFSADHAEPISRNGTFEIDNIVICCKECNMIKGALNHHEFSRLLQLINSWPYQASKDLLSRLKAGGGKKYGG